MNVRVLAGQIDATQMHKVHKGVLPEAFKLVMCATVLYGILPVLRHSRPAGNVQYFPTMIDAIIQTMGEHLDYARAQERCCLALWSLAGNDANRVEIAKQGGIDTIIKVTGEHPDSNVQEYLSVLSLGAQKTGRESPKQAGNHQERRWRVSVIAGNDDEEDHITRNVVSNRFTAPLFGPVSLCSLPM